MASRLLIDLQMENIVEGTIVRAIQKTIQKSARVLKSYDWPKGLVNLEMISRMKIVCEVCGNLGQLQHISENYYWVKHYLGSVNGKLKFEYHKQSLEHIKSILDASKELKAIDPIGPKNYWSKSLK